MKNRTNAHIAILLFCLSFTAIGQSSDEMKIRMLQDARDAVSADLLAYLHSPEPRYRELALLALANIQDSASNIHVVPLLNDPHPSVRSMAAFALGMSGNRIAASFLLNRIPAEPDVRCTEAVIQSVGLCGSAEDLAELMRKKDELSADHIGSVLRTVARFANRKIVDPDANRFAVSLLEDSVHGADALYALMRVNDAGVIFENRRTLARLLDHPSPAVRMWSATALRGVNDAAILERLMICAEQDSDWRVRVNALAAVRTTSAARNRMLSMAFDPNGHVSLAALTGYETLTRNETLWPDSALLLSLLSSASVAPQAREEARKIIAAKMGVRAYPYIGDWRSDQPYVSAQRVKSYGSIRSAQSVNILREILTQSDQSIVTIAAIESYHSSISDASAVEQEKFLNAIVPLLNRRDAGISYAVATVFQDTALQLPLRRKFLPELVRSYNAMDASADLEPMIEFLKIFGAMADTSSLSAVRKGLTERNGAIRSAAQNAFTAITGTEFMPATDLAGDSHAPMLNDSNYILLERYTGATIRSSKGTFSIRFEKNAAPMTVLNFILLVKKGFYNGLYFHRVVGNFVIQGGDPLGNGSGGPHYTIRTEVHPDVRYTTGAVGMASAGRDTEGSQWFVTHCPTPHLDYRYTIFGYTDGMDVVDAIMIGDRIDSIELF